MAEEDDDGFPWASEMNKCCWGWISLRIVFVILMINRNKRVLVYITTPGKKYCKLKLSLKKLKRISLFSTTSVTEIAKLIYFSLILRTMNIPHTTRFGLSCSLTRKFESLFNSTVTLASSSSKQIKIRIKNLDAWLFKYYFFPHLDHQSVK